MPVEIHDVAENAALVASAAAHAVSVMKIDGRDRDVRTATIGGKTIVYTDFLTVSEKRKLSRAMLPNDVMAPEAYGYNQVAARVRMIDGNPIGLLTGPTTGAAPTGANYPSLPPPSVMITPPPARGFELQGAPYGPGTALVPVGQATGGYTGGYGSYAAWRAAGAPPDPNLPSRWRDPSAGTGFTMGGRPGQAADEPFNEPGPVRLYDMPSRGEFYAAGYGAQMLGGAAGGLVDQSFMAAAGVDQLKGALAAQGLTKDQVENAYAQAVKTQHDVLGTYIGQNLGLIIRLMALTQDAGAATAMLPEMARAQQVFAGLGRDGSREIGAAMQSAELRGVLFHKNAQTGKEEADLPAIANFLKNMETITAMSGGRYGPGDVLQLLKSGGVAASIMSDANGFAEMMPIIQSLGAARAGTALRAFSLQFSAGKMADASMNDLIDIGLIPENVMGQDVWRELQAKRIAHGEKPQKMPAGLPEHGVLYHEKVGIGQQRLLPGAMSQADFEMINSHPEQYVLERLLPAVQAYEAKTYGKAYTGADDRTKLAYESAEMQRLASRIPGGVFDSDLIRLAPLIKRDVNAFNNARKGDAYKSVVTDNPMMQLQGFQAAVNALQVTLGNQNMAMSIATMKALTAALGADTVTNTGAATGGSDTEVDAAFRTRFWGYLQYLYRATGQAVTYAIQTVQPGLAVSITDGYDQAGQFAPGTFFCTVDDGTGSPSSQLLTSAGAQVQATRALGIRGAVVAPTTVAANVAATIAIVSGYDGTVVGPVAQAAATAFVSAVTLGQSLSYFRLGAAIQSASPGVSEVVSLTINGVAADLTATSRQKIIPGSIIITPAS